MEQSVQDYLCFLKYCLHGEEEVPRCVERISWTDLLCFAKKQGIVGVYWDGIVKMPNSTNNKPSEDDVMDWMGETVKLQRHGKKLDNRTVEVFNNLRADGFECCVLKGQTNNRFYPSTYSRTPGDIDIWVYSSRNRLLHYILDKFGKTVVSYHHLDYPSYSDTPIDAHTTPIYSTNPFNNIRVQKYFQSEAKRQMTNVIPLADGSKVYGLTNDVNLLFQLMHLHKHLCYEGIGIRQLIDYFYLLKGASISQEETISLINNIKRMHLAKFANGIMYILHTKLGLDRKYCYMSEDPKEGEYILSQMLIGGNFGRYDQRVQNYQKRKYVFMRYPRKIAFVLSKWKHDPYEISWMPVFITVNWFIQHWYKWHYHLKW